MVMFQAVSPTRLLYSSCSLEKTLQCNCSFHGIPTPSVQWLMEGVPVDVNSTDNIFQVTSTIIGPWTNSTISLIGEPEIVMSLRCEGKNQYGTHTSSIFLLPDKRSVYSVFMKGLIQGIVYGSTASALFFFFLILLAMKILKWWEDSHIPKARETPVIQKPELPEEPETAVESEAKTPGPQLESRAPERGQTMDRQTPRRIKTQAWIEDAETDRPSQTSQTYRAGAATLSETLRPETTARSSRIPWADIPPKTPGCWASWSAPTRDTPASCP
ncbi:SIGLEC family-like protein 1 [Herpailurus yagouaroundi]|uniref:SIGLEC family-like protein 1 n=1 Tax=Herpailurus yagouaroundi TaxID=1608482 RepID=UPI001AD6AC09|nr:SIGLEC family-like protein 1 [Puma yagouaroundi]